MDHTAAKAVVERITEYTIDFLARSHAVAHADIVAGLLAGDAKLLGQWETCFRWSSDLVTQDQHADEAALLEGGA